MFDFHVHIWVKKYHFGNFSERLICNGPPLPGTVLAKNFLLQFQNFVLQLNTLKITNVYAAHQAIFPMRISIGVKNATQTQYIQLQMDPLHIGRI